VGCDKGGGLEQGTQGVGSTKQLWQVTVPQELGGREGKGTEAGLRSFATGEIVTARVKTVTGEGWTEGGSEIPPGRGTA